MASFMNSPLPEKAFSQENGVFLGAKIMKLKRKKVGQLVPLEPHAGVDHEAGGNVVVVMESLCSIVQLHLGQWQVYGKSQSQRKVFQC